MEALLWQRLSLLSACTAASGMGLWASSFCRTKKGRTLCPALGSTSENSGVRPCIWQGMMALHKAWFIRGISGICPNKLKICITDVLWLIVVPDIKLQEQWLAKKNESWYRCSQTVLLMVTVVTGERDALFYIRGKNHQTRSQNRKHFKLKYMDSYLCVSWYQIASYSSFNLIFSPLSTSCTSECVQINKAPATDLWAKNCRMLEISMNVEIAVWNKQNHPAAGKTENCSSSEGAKRKPDLLIPPYLS